MSPGLGLCVFSDRDAWDLVAQIVVRESAVAAGLRVAAPYGAGPASRLVVFTGPHDSGEPLRARVVHVQAVGYGEARLAAPGDLVSGELLAVYEVGSANADSVYLFTLDQVREAGGRWMPGQGSSATPEHWRELLER